MSLTALREIFRHFAPSELPADFAACLAGDEQAIAANHAAHRLWEKEDERRRSSGQDQAAIPTPQAVTQDPVQQHLIPLTSEPAAPNRPHPSSHASPHRPLVATQVSTVHRTDPHTTRGKRTQPDMALQVCPKNSSHNTLQITNCWDPSVLFPEICASVQSPQAVINKKEKRGPTRTKTLQMPRPNLRKSTRIKKEGKGLLDIDAQDFTDIPLQQAEGREILALIGATNVAIPAHIMLPSTQQMSNMEVGQPSRAQPKRTKPTMQEALQEQSSAQQLQPAMEHMDPLGSAELTAHSVHLNQLGNEPGQETFIADTPLLMNDDSLNPLDAQEDDPYLDQVDYSEEEVDL